MDVNTIGVAIQTVQSAYSKGLHSDDTRLRPLHIYSVLVRKRASLIEKEIKRKRNRVNEWYYHTLPCVELEKVSAAECGCVPDLGCYFYRSKCKLPTPIEGLMEQQIRAVTSLDGLTRFDSAIFETVKNKDGAKYTANTPVFFIKNEYLYAKAGKSFIIPKYVTVTMLLADPSEVIDFCDVCNEPGADSLNECEDVFEVNFSLQGEKFDKAITETVNELLGVYAYNNRGDDRKNDAGDDIQK